MWRRPRGSCGRYWLTTLLPATRRGCRRRGRQVEHVIPGAAQERVRACASAEDVVPVAAVGAQLNRVRRESGAVDDIVTGECVDLQLVLRRLGVGDAHPGRQPGHADAAGAAGRGDRVGTVGAVDDDPVGAGVVGGAA